MISRGRKTRMYIRMRTWAASSLLGAPLVVAVVIAVTLMFIVGFLIERVALRRLTGQPMIMIIMLTIGLEIFLRGLVPGLWAPRPNGSISAFRRRLCFWATC